MNANSILFFVLALLLMVVGVRSIVGSMAALQAKGYSEAVNWRWILMFAPFAGMLPAFGLASYLHDRSPRGINLFLAVSAVGIAAAGALTVHVIEKHVAAAPRVRKTPRKWPYPEMALISGAGILVVPTIALLAGSTWKNALELARGPLILFMVFYSMARRQRLPTADDDMRKDPRPPVLYIRPFATETAIFARKKLTGPFRFLPILEQHASEGEISERAHLSLPAFFSSQIRESVGPLVALGSPWDLLPQDDGASRGYSADEDWQTKFCSLADEAAFVLTSSDMSGNLIWELRFLRMQGLAYKLFVCTPPDLGDNVERVMLTLWGFLFGRHALRYWGLRRPEWSKVAAELGKLGYLPPDEDPGQGAVIASDADGKMTVIVRGARTAEEYVAAIQNYRAGMRAASA